MIRARTAVSATAELHHIRGHDLLTFREIFADLMGKAGGRIFNTAGDAVLAECPSAVEALRAAIDIQESVRTCNLGLPKERQMLFRIGITIGDVLERDGDLLGDGVNIAARLESLAKPGGICVSRNIYEQVSNKIDVQFRDIGPQVVKNLPKPIHAFVIGEKRSKDVPITRRKSLTIWLGSSALVLVIAAVGIFAFKRWEATRSDDGRIFGFEAQAVPDTDQVDTPFDPGRIPFVCASCKAEISAAVSQGVNSAVALSNTGAYGYAAKLPMVDDARNKALADCANHRTGNGICQLYAVNGVVVWPRTLRMPPHPWVDPSVKPSPFDVAKLSWNRAETDAANFGAKYSRGNEHKAVALDSRGIAYYRAGLGSKQEAEEKVLEMCSDRTRMACRVVAVDDSFVVEPTTEPIPLPH